MVGHKRVRIFDNDNSLPVSKQRYRRQRVAHVTKLHLATCKNGQPKLTVGSTQKLATHGSQHFALEKAIIAENGANISQRMLVGMREKLERVDDARFRSRRLGHAMSVLLSLRERNSAPVIGCHAFTR
jgi:hypothetical protein